jgi:transposase InsO family protein
MFRTIINACKKVVNFVKEKIKQLLKPAPVVIAAGALADLPRSKSDLIVENAILRQQLIVLNRTVKRPKLTSGDRVGFLFLSRLTRFWDSALHIIKPETLLKWHRGLFKHYWRWKSKPKTRKPRIPQETTDLIKQMAVENRRWGAKRIVGELLKLEIVVHKRTVMKYMRQARKKKSGQTWATFLRNHAKAIWACDYTVVNDLLFRPIHIFVIIHHQTRCIIHFAVTTSPSDEWVTQQIREATPWGIGPKYLIFDNDGKFGVKFKAIVHNTGIKALNTPYHAPRANSICERFFGTLRRECLDNFLILNQEQVHRIVKVFVAFYNGQRPHQGIEQKIPQQFDRKHPVMLSNKVKGRVISTPVLSGLHHSYAYA